jgi:hypothetical protein
MYLRALSIGYAVPDENFDAAVHSVFQSAINLRPAGEGELLTLVISSEADLPQGIRLDTPESFSFEEFQIGESVVCRDGILQFEGSSLTVQLRGARRWKCDLSRLEADLTNPTASTAWSLVWEALNKRQQLLHADIVASDLLHPEESARLGTARKAGQAMRELLQATRQYDSAGTAAVNALIGLGSGLTPSGDDLLVGYLAGLWCVVRDQNERAQFISDLGKTIISLSRQTNDISRTYLYHAAQGQVSSRLADLAEAISEGQSPNRLLKIAEAAISVGHTSGMETVTGLMMGLAAWEGDHLLSI